VNLKSDSRPATTAVYDLAFILPAMRVALTSSFYLCMGPDSVELVPGRYATVPGTVRIANCTSLSALSWCMIGSLNNE